MRLVQLLEADVLGVLMEALPAEVEVVLPDQAVPASINFRPTLSFFLPSLSILFHIFPFSLSSPIAASFTLPRAGSKLPWSGIPDVVMTHFNSTDHSLQKHASINSHEPTYIEYHTPTKKPKVPTISCHVQQRDLLFSDKQHTA